MPNTREKLIELLTQVAVLGDYLDMRKVADHLIANGVTISNLETVNKEWIPVTERLPENNEMVLICSKINNQYVAQHFRGRFYSDGTRISTTHWMPLPDPPKGE